MLLKLHAKTQIVFKLLLCLLDVGRVFREQFFIDFERSLLIVCSLSVFLLLEFDLPQGLEAACSLDVVFAIHIEVLLQTCLIGLKSLLLLVNF